tara:strand:- start:31 stop:546 length:516 start_codon:yes stop_codon:yes gene_type:complete
MCLAYVSVPLYDLFCRVTGYGGTPAVANSVPNQVDNTVKVRFNADIGRNMPWAFKPLQGELEVRLGEPQLVFFEIKNKGFEEIIGTSTFNVTPHKVGLYFGKIDCFCYEQQILAPGETLKLPVSFVIDPALLEDPNTSEVKTITLSYMFFNTKINAYFFPSSNYMKVIDNL